MYGKVDPGARQPYRCAREKGILPGCKCNFSCFLYLLFATNIGVRRKWAIAKAKYKINFSLEYLVLDIPKRGKFNTFTQYFLNQIHDSVHSNNINSESFQWKGPLYVRYNWLHYLPIQENYDFSKWNVV